MFQLYIRAVVGCGGVLEGDHSLCRALVQGREPERVSICGPVGIAASAVPLHHDDMQNLVLDIPGAGVPLDLAVQLARQ